MDRRTSRHIGTYLVLALKWEMYDDWKGFHHLKKVAYRPIRIRLYIKNETSLKKRNLERNRPKKTQPRRRQVSEKKTQPAFF